MRSWMLISVKKYVSKKGLTTQKCIYYFFYFLQFQAMFKLKRYGANEPSKGLHYIQEIRPINLKELKKLFPEVLTFEGQRAESKYLEVKVKIKDNKGTKTRWIQLEPAFFFKDKDGNSPSPVDDPKPGTSSSS